MFGFRFFVLFLSKFRTDLLCSNEESPTHRKKVQSAPRASQESGAFPARDTRFTMKKPRATSKGIRLSSWNIEAVFSRHICEYSRQGPWSHPMVPLGVLLKDHLLCPLVEKFSFSNFVSMIFVSQFFWKKSALKSSSLPKHVFSLSARCPSPSSMMCRRSTPHFANSKSVVRRTSPRHRICFLVCGTRLRLAVRNALFCLSTRREHGFLYIFCFCGARAICLFLLKIYKF